MSLVDRIDAVAADLVELDDITPKTVRKYQRPQIITPELCPMLAVFPKQADPAMLATDSSYQRDDVLIVLWVENAADSLTTGQWSETASKAALARAESIVEQLQTYGDGVPELAEQNEATVHRVRWGILDGGVWAAEIDLRVGTWS